MSTKAIIVLAVVAAYWAFGLWMLWRPKQAGPEGFFARIGRYLKALLWLPIAILRLLTGGDK